LPSADEPSIPAPQRAKEAADDPAPPSRAGFTSGMAKLGWIRRPVPTDTLPEAPFPENRQLRRPTAGRDADPHGKEPSTTKHSTDASAANASEGAQPQPTQHQGQGRPPIGRSAGPAIKPIGGGILRRR